MKKKKDNKIFEKRSHPREKISVTTFYATQDGLYEGMIEDIGMRGIFLKTEEPMNIGDIITVAVPALGTQGEHKLRGEIVRKDMKGVGIEFKKSLNE